jgi:hypothetical protein
VATRNIPKTNEGIVATLRFDNPFHDLWVTEILDPAAYVRMFSDILVKDTEALFSKGHVALKGRQGSGKSMLLNLLVTSTRVAYAKSDSKYPIPSKHRKFISAGVQLTLQNASLAAARAEEIDESQRLQVVAMNFSDYLNTLLCLDLLRNVRYLHEQQKETAGLLDEIPVNLDAQIQSEFFRVLLRCDAWDGFIDPACVTVDQAIASLEARLKAHRNYGNVNIDRLPENIESSRSQAGIPMSDLAAALRSSGVLPAETLVMLRIDQHEELFELERRSGLGHVFRQVINSALARRDPNVAYRIGTRHYAWDADLSCWGSGAPLENERDYSIVDLDAILRRGEHTKSWKFPLFAKDVLDKRLEAAGFKHTNDALNSLFGRSLEPAEKARKYAHDSVPLLKFEDTWAPEWKEYLAALWLSNPLEAKLGEAWLRQRLQVKGRVGQTAALATGLPWHKSKWWVKERNEIALMHLAGDRRQALIWSGERQIIALAGYNILAFMTVCKTIWATWQRRNPKEAETRGTLPTFSIEDQVIGVTEASQAWFKKMQVGLDADHRARLVSALGGWFRKRMLEDRALSYPGHSGFSLLAENIAATSTRLPEVVAVIKVCRDHGDLLESPHTTKSDDQAPRVKWYLHPLLCPLFRIPHVRTKEPIYTNVPELQRLYANQSRQGPAADEMSREQEDKQAEFPGM